MLKKILFITIVSISNTMPAMQGEIKIPDQIKDARAEEAQRTYFYPEVAAAFHETGRVLANHYFTKELPKTHIAGAVEYSKALKYWRFGSNLPEAGLVVPLVKEWTQLVLTGAFLKRKTILSGMFIDNELAEAVAEINEKIAADQQQRDRYKNACTHIEKFSTEIIIPRESPGHD